jgi:Flp pilus assembly protein TadG
MNFLKNNRGAALVEFALVALPVIVFIFGIIQTAWVLWTDNLLHVSVNVAARCAAVGSTTAPCTGNTVAEMISTAKTAFAPMSNSPNVSFKNNGPCNNDGGAGVIGTYTINILYAVDVTLEATSCYPTAS